MESITRNIHEITSDERRIYEAAFGHALQENQQVIIQIINLGKSSSGKTLDEPDESGRSQPSAKLPDWCNVFTGLTDGKVAEVEQVALQRSDMTRSSQ